MKVEFSQAEQEEGAPQPPRVSLPALHQRCWARAKPAPPGHTVSPQQVPSPSQLPLTTSSCLSPDRNHQAALR